jgi:hypothetical protein
VDVPADIIEDQLMQDEGMSEDNGQDDYDAEWDDALYGDEVDDMVAEVNEQMEKEQKLEALLEEICIEYKPPDYKPGCVAFIVGDFTDWTPDTMQMYPVSEVLADPSKLGLFFYICKVVKGYRYRYLFLMNERERVDTSEGVAHNRS